MYKDKLFENAHIQMHLNKTISNKTNDAAARTTVPQHPARFHLMRVSELSLTVQKCQNCNKFHAVRPGCLMTPNSMAFNWS
jgi:hypothetical protein